MRIGALAALIAALLSLNSMVEKAEAGLYVSITVAPPPLPVYVQPAIPGPGYMWAPGYWAWDDSDGDYYWVPGAWVPAPSPGLLWTPGYWGWSNGVYAWNDGYWGPHVGFYGGVVYGFGYGGVGFGGGRWVGGSFSYNRSVTNIGTTTITNVYSQKIVVNTTTNVSFNGGNGGIQAQPNAQELAAAKEPHTAPSGDQVKHRQLARENPSLKRSKNGGKPPIAATRTAGDFSKKNVVAAKSAGGSLTRASFRDGSNNQTNKLGAQGAHKPLDRAGGSNASANLRPSTNGSNKPLTTNRGVTNGGRPPANKPPQKQVKKPGERPRPQ
jgi:hypothetical protein